MKIVALIRWFFGRCNCDPFYGIIDTECEACWPWKRTHPSAADKKAE